MSGNYAIWFGIILLLFLGGGIGWWLSKVYHESAYKRLLDTSIEVNKITIKSLEESMIKIRQEKAERDAQGKN
jgi:hypothetical protein